MNHILNYKAKGGGPGLTVLNYLYVHSKNGKKIETFQSSNDVNNVQPIIEMNPTQKLNFL